MTDLKKVVGYRSGEFANDRGEVIKFTHLYFEVPREGVTGLAVDIGKCKTSDVLEGVKIGDYVELYYDEKKRVVLVQPVVPSASDLADFEYVDPDSLTVDDLVDESV